jgi:hypothetical protein
MKKFKLSDKTYYIIKKNKLNFIIDDNGNKISKEYRSIDIFGKYAICTEIIDSCNNYIYNLIEILTGEILYTSHNIIHLYNNAFIFYIPSPNSQYFNGILINLDFNFKLQLEHFSFLTISKITFITNNKYFVYDIITNIIYAIEKFPIVKIKYHNNYIQYSLDGLLFLNKKFKQFKKVNCYVFSVVKFNYNVFILVKQNVYDLYYKILDYKGDYIDGIFDNENSAIKYIDNINNIKKTVKLRNLKLRKIYE